MKEGKISDADAIHTHHEYNKSDSTEANINMVEAHLRSLETKAEKNSYYIIAYKRRWI